MGAADKEATVTITETARYKITIPRQANRRYFDRAVACVKCSGAEYDPDTKTWTLELGPDDSERDPLRYGRLGEATRYYGVTVEQVS